MRRLLSTVAIPLLLIIAACRQGQDDAPNGPDTPAPAPVLGGVDLGQPVRVLGTEPFWGVDITPAALVYGGVDRPEQRAANPGPVIQGTTAVYSATTDAGATLVLTLIATECSDGMSDRTYPLTARLELGPETLQGCAASAAALTGEAAPAR